VISNAEPEVPFVSRTVELSGTLPRQVRVFDPLSGATVLETFQTTKFLDLSTLPFGNFLVQHWASGALSRYVVVANSATAFEAFDPAVTFEGTLPRRLIFSDARTNLDVWDSWIYGSTVNVLGLLPPGEYKVRHASSGQPYQQGMLVVGAQLPSYRLYTEQVSPSAIRIDWGPFGSELSARVQVFEDSQLILDVTQEESPVVLDVPQGNLSVQVTVAGHEQSVQHCSLPQLAQDGTCRSFSQSLYFNFVSNAMIGFSVPGAVPTNPDVTAEIVIVEPPLHGTLVRGDEEHFQTYIPNPGFAGSDAAVLRVIYSDGTQTDILVTLVTTTPAVPAFAHFVPGIGTTQPDYRTPPPAELEGNDLPYDLIVNSDFGKVVERINGDGSTVWRHIQSSPTLTVAVLGNEVFVAGMRSIRVLDAETGILKRSIPVGLEANEVLQFANPIDSQRFLVSWFTDSDLSYVGIWSVNQGWEWISNQTYLWPRWADLQEDLLVIADTYGHRVVGESVTDGNIVFEIPAYFPNDVRWIGESSVLIAEEHADRVWAYDWLTEERELVISAPGPRSDLQLPFDVVLALSNSADLRIIPSSRTSLSKSSTEFSGTDTVYAPNGAVQLPDGSFYVADTDNHRVIHVSGDGDVLSELVGINNPTKIAYLWDPPPPVVNPPLPSFGSVWPRDILF
jgi:hypothetical protein